MQKIHKSALSYYTIPLLTWLQKYWIAMKTKDYQALYPVTENTKRVALVKKLQTADDQNQFPKSTHRALNFERMH